MDELDEGLTNLQVLYEKYFLGIDRRAPEQERKKISTRLHELRSAMIRNTALKFRVQTLFAKLISFERMWDRTLREIEDGTYKRDVFKAKMHMKEKVQEKPPERKKETMTAVGPEISDDKLRRLYDTYLVARQRCGETTDGMSYDSVAQRIRAQVPALLQKHKARNIEFKVVIKGGKAVLKAIPHT